MMFRCTCFCGNHLNIRIYTFIQVCMCVYVCVYVCVCVYVYVCDCVYMCVCVSVRVSVSVLLLLLFNDTPSKCFCGYINILYTVNVSK